MGIHHIAAAFAFVMMAASAAYAADPLTTPAPRITIRIYDYAVIPANLLARSQKVVDRLYAEIGVKVDWAETIIGGTPAGDPIQIDPRELIVIILNPRMSQRQLLPENVVGVAATTPDASGRMAYVLYDRLDKLDFASDNHVMDAMGLVIAHELGHLLLPHGSHAPAGLMQPVWSLGMLQTDQGQFGLSPAQGQVIRRALQAAAPDVRR
jgi:hypothetical protein